MFIINIVLTNPMGTIFDIRKYCNDLIPTKEINCPYCLLFLYRNEYNTKSVKYDTFIYGHMKINIFNT